jgi:aryl-alcohol dehydrogenase-like predicted oxidoreductase
LAQDQLVIPIPGTKKEKYYKENMGALDIKLTKEELEGIRREIEKVEIIGHRYSEANRGNLYVDTVPL